MTAGFIDLIGTGASPDFALAAIIRAHCLKPGSIFVLASLSRADKTISSVVSPLWMSCKRILPL